MNCPPDWLAIDRRVHEGFGKPGGSGLSLAEWCQRNVHRWKGRKRRAALLLLNLRGWDAMVTADRELRGLARGGPELR